MKRGLFSYLSLIIGVFFLTACDDAPAGDPCQGVTCDAGYRCESTGAGVRCVCDDCGDADIDTDPDNDVDVDVETDGDADADADGDLDLPRPVITSIEGTGMESGINPWRPEDRSVFDEYEGHRGIATNRINSESPELIIRGGNLEGTTSVIARHPEGDTIDFEIIHPDPEEETMDEVRVRFPEMVPEIMISTLLTLTLVTSVGEAQEHVFFLQGEPGEDCAASVLECVDEDGEQTCSLTGDLDVSGSISANSGIFENSLTLGGRSVWEPECPRGYERYSDREFGQQIISSDPATNPVRLS